MNHGAGLLSYHCGVTDGPSNRPLFWGVVTSLAAHVLAAAAVLSMPPIQPSRSAAAMPLAGDSAPMMLIPLTPPEPKPEPTPPPPPPPEPKVIEPPRPEEPTPVRLGVEGSTTVTPNWLQSLLEGEHGAPSSTVEQPALTTRMPEPPPAPPPSAPAGATAAAPPTPPAAASVPTPPAPSTPSPQSDQSAPPEEPSTPAPDAMPSPIEQAPPPLPAATAPPPKPSVPTPAPGRGREGEADPSAAARELLPVDAKPTPPTNAPVEPPKSPEELLREELSKPVEPRAAGPLRDGPAESPTREDPTTPPRDEVGPPDALFQRPPPAPSSPRLRDRLDPPDAARPTPPTDPREPSPPTATPAPSTVLPAGPMVEPRPSGRAIDAIDRQAAPADRESDAASPRRTAVYRNGRVNAGEGLEIKTVRPQFSRLALAFASPRAAVVEMFFDRDGIVRRVTILRSTGFPQEIDEPIKNAVFNWRASGRLVRELPNVPDAGVTVRIEFLMN